MNVVTFHQLTLTQVFPHQFPSLVQNYVLVVELQEVFLNPGVTGSLRMEFLLFIYLHII